MTTAIQNSAYTIKMVNLTTRKISEFHLRGNDTVDNLVSDILAIDMVQAMRDGDPRALIITLHPSKMRLH